MSTGNRLPAARLIALPDTGRTVRPVLELGRSVALVAPGKAGKSLLALELAAAIATGRAILTDTDVRPRRVLYLDYENAPSDVLKRLLAMAYEPSDLSNLLYSSFPDLQPLNTRAGGQALLRVVDELRPELVVIDSLIRAVTGDENDSRTVHDLYRETLLPRKQRGVGLQRSHVHSVEMHRGPIEA